MERNTSFPEYQTANQIQGYALSQWSLKNAVDFFFFINNNNNNNNIKSQTNSKHTLSHSENFYNLPERLMTLSKVLKKLPNYIKHNEVIQIQVQWQAGKCMAFEQ